MNLYTSRSDIPKYTRHEGPGERVYGNVVEDGNDQRDNNTQENNTAAVNDNNNTQANNQAASSLPERQDGSNQNNENDVRQGEEDKEGENVLEPNSDLNLPTERRSQNQNNGQNDTQSNE